MNQLQVFNFTGKDVRVVVKDGHPWWVAKDVSELLGFRMASDFTRTLDDDEKDTQIVRTPEKSRSNHYQ
ncbi:BRO family protein [Paenibacillus larvae]|nr:BRO family protein [Paenibacillus larvae]MDT2294822.1 BRO family protein [Paenibacillus larvae]